MTDETEVEAPRSVKLCQEPGCLKEGGFGPFGRYCEEHGPLHRPGSRKAREGAPAAPRARAPRRGALTPKIKDTMMMTAAVAAIRDPRIYIAVEATVDEFAVAWNNVAETSPTARRYIEMILDGGVWITAAGATMVMGVTVLACTENLPPRFATLGQYCLAQAGITMVPAQTNGQGPPITGVPAQEPEPWAPDEAA